MKGHLVVAEYLAPKMEGHLFDRDDVGHTALHLAAYFGHLSMVEYLVRSCGFDVKAIDKVGHLLLLQVIAYHFLMCETIIQYNNLCCEYFIVCFFTSCMCRYIVHACVPVVFVCMESSSTVEPL